jgi:hypothetical protein
MDGDQSVAPAALDRGHALHSNFVRAMLQELLLGIA